MGLALEGIKVLDVSQVAAVPMAARHLADFGADVIHVEHPLRGDSWRVYQAGIGTGTSGVPSHINYNWENYNRNKKSLTLDLSMERGREIIYKLVETADVFLTNLRPQDLEKFSLTYENLSKINTKIIYGSLTGYGKKGDEKNSPGYDYNAYWYRGAIPYMLSWPGMPPPGFRPAYGDNVAALSLAYGVMMALFVRERTGEGQEIDISLLHTGIYVNSYDIAGALVTGRDYEDWRPHSREDIPNALVNVYPTKDGRWMNITLLQPDRYWARFCQAIEREDLEHDHRFETFEAKKQNHTVLFHLLEEVFLTKTLAEWKTRLFAAGLPFAAMQNLVDVTTDPQARANDLFFSFNHPEYGKIEVIANPVNLSKTPATIRMPAPELGQHTEEILLELGYNWEDIALFKNTKVI